MDALKIALETIIVGALALPWMYLIVHLFCPSKEDFLKKQSDKLKTDANQAKVAGALLFAVAYVIGSSVVRLSEDFFNDDDLPLHLTERKIQANVYCSPESPWLLEPWLTSTKAVPKSLSGPCPKGQVSTETTNVVAHWFALEEAALWITASDKVDRLRYLRQQIVVLRGAAFDGVVITLLCLFAALTRCHGHYTIVLKVLAGALCLFSLWALGKHLLEHWFEQHNMAGNPPSMEFVLLGLAIAGLLIARKQVVEGSYTCGFVFSALLSAVAFSGWWYTEVLYGKTIIYFYYAQSHLISSVTQ